MGTTLMALISLTAFFERSTVGSFCTALTLALGVAMLLHKARIAAIALKERVVLYYPSFRGEEAYLVLHLYAFVQCGDKSIESVVG